MKKRKRILYARWLARRWWTDSWTHVSNYFPSRMLNYEIGQIERFNFVVSKTGGSYSIGIPWGTPNE